MNYIEERPWGMFEVLLDSDDCKVKRITVYPGKRLSYQYHNKRNEVWTVVSGNATITLVFIEVQYGSYFGEDDIVRIEDDYDRK